MPTRTALAVLLSTLALVSFSSCGSDDASPEGVLNVSRATGALQVSCNASPSAGPVPLIVNLTASVQGNTPSYRLLVDFGDGTTGDNGNVSHLYSTAGGYAIRWVATAEGQTAECRQSVTAQPHPPSTDRPPVLVVRTNPSPATGPAPLTVNFNLCTSQDPEGQRLSYRFDFGDGRVNGWSADCGKANTYAAGTYTGTFCVTDDEPGHEVCDLVSIVAQ